MEYIVIPGCTSPVSNVKITLLDCEVRQVGKVGGCLPNELVTSVRDEIYDLAWALDIEQVASDFHKEEVE